ncbi:FtsX-like permease family protein [Streptomyces sp. NPDC048383]|uniref:FtsX-like permease family protein n=1 Tax=Streptomyces sp. NPDC048383 TaxID=3155386 RepID=UPI00341C75E5
MNRHVAMIRLGHRVGMSSGVSALVHRFGLFAASFLVLWVAWSLLAVDAALDARQERQDARSPVMTQQSQEAVARWLERPDYADGQAISVVFLEPLRPDAAPPPGLERWPERGESFLSPQAAEHAGGTLISRYGTMAGTIGRTGLAEPNELLVYTRSPVEGIFGETNHRTLVSGFGQPNSQFVDYFTVSHQFERSSSDLWVLLLLFTVMPAAASLTVVVGGGAELRDRRISMLEALGASRASRLLVVIGEAAVPVLAGSLLASAAAWATTVWDTDLPFTGHTVSAGDMAPLRVWTPLLIVVATALVLGVGALRYARPPMRKTTRPRQTKDTSGRTVWVLGSIGTALCLYGTSRADGPGRVVFFFGVMLVIGALPSLGGRLSGSLGSAVASLSIRKGDAAGLIAGRWLAARPAVLATLSAAMIVGLGLTTLGQVVTSQLEGPEIVAKRLAGATNRNAVLINASGNPARFDQLREQLADHPSALMYREGDRTMLSADCKTLAFFGTLTTCPTAATELTDAVKELGATPRTALAVLGLSPDQVSITSHHPGITDPVGVSLVVFNTTGGPGADRIWGTAYRTLGFPMLDVPVESGMLGAQARADYIKWVLDTALIGLLALVLAGIVGAASVFDDQARGLGPIASFRRDRRFYLRVAFWNLSVPLAVVGAGAGVATYLLGRMLLSIGDGGELSGGLVAAGSFGIAISGVAVAVVCAEIAVRRSRTWLPTGD